MKTLPDDLVKREFGSSNNEIIVFERNSISFRKTSDRTSNCFVPLLHDYNQEHMNSNSAYNERNREIFKYEQNYSSDEQMHIKIKQEVEDQENLINTLYEEEIQFVDVQENNNIIIDHCNPNTENIWKKDAFWNREIFKYEQNNLSDDHVPSKIKQEVDNEEDSFDTLFMEEIEFVDVQENKNIIIDDKNNDEGTSRTEYMKEYRPKNKLKEQSNHLNVLLTKEHSYATSTKFQTEYLNEYGRKVELEKQNYKLNASIVKEHSYAKSQTEYLKEYQQKVELKKQIDQLNALLAKEHSYAKLDPVEMGTRVVLNSERESFECEKKGASEMLSAIEMKRCSQECDLPKTSDSVRSKPRNHKCDLCDYTTSQKTSLQEHIKSVHLKKYKCQLCNYRSSQKNGLEIHIKSVHLKLKDNICHLCNYRSSHKYALLKHIKSVHLKMKNFECHLCNFSSSQKVNLKKHIETVHLKMRNFECHLCDYNSSLEGNIQRHLKSVHLKIKNHQCYLCNFSASQKVNLQRHFKTVHSKLGNFKCHLCDYSSSQKAILQMHVRSVHLKMQKTHSCGNRSSLKEHYRVLICETTNDTHLQMLIN